MPATHSPTEAAVWLRLLRQKSARLLRPVRFMEVCGTHTMALFETGLREALPESVEMLSGPGCPVCVTPDGYVDAAIRLGEEHGVTLATFGDMVRVPGPRGSLADWRSRGGRIEVLYSPLDAVELARREPARQHVFLAVGFETTAPAVARGLELARSERLLNFSILPAHKTIPPALDALLASGARLDGLLLPGHVSVIIGARAYEPLASTYHVPCVVSGFQAADMARALTCLVEQVLAGRAEVENAYTRAVQPEGHRPAQELLRRVFQPCDAAWRGLGVIPGSGLEPAGPYGSYDARLRFGCAIPESPPRPGCRCGDILRGAAKPAACALFGRACTPDAPYGPCMVSSEGACAAYYKYGPREQQ
jgi:hydrogenase expression/formation protein HypD